MVGCRMLTYTRLVFKYVVSFSHSLPKLQSLTSKNIHVEIVNVLIFFNSSSKDLFCFVCLLFHIFVFFYFAALIIFLFYSLLFFNLKHVKMIIFLYSFLPIIMKTNIYIIFGILYKVRYINLNMISFV